MGSLLLKGLSGCASRGSLGFGFLFSIKGLDSQQKLSIKAATECCVSFGSFTRPPRWPLPILGTHIIFILSRVAGAAIFRFNWQKTLQPVQLQISLQVKSAALESWGSCLRKCECPPSSKPEIYFRECYLCVCLSLCFHDADGGRQ